MPSKKNQLKPINFGPRLDIPPEAASTTSCLTQERLSQPTRVLTGRAIKNAYNQRQPLTSTSTGVYTGGDIPKSASPLTQNLPGQGSSPVGASSTRTSSPELSQTRASSPPGHNDPSIQGWSSDYPDPCSPTESPIPKNSTSATQWTKWTNTVIPSLTGLYFDLMLRTESLGSVNRSYAPICTCHRKNARTLNVTCVYFDCTCNIL